MGYIGLGIMGSRMAAILLANGHALAEKDGPGEMDFAAVWAYLSK